MASLNLTFDNITNADLLVGDASVVGDWNTFFDLPTYGTSFSAVTISGNTVQLFGGSNITLKESLFESNINIIQVIDFDGSVVSGNNYCFNSCSSLTSIDLPSLTTAANSCFSYCSSLTSIDLPSLTTAANSCFAGLSSITSVNLPSLTTAGRYCFYDCLSLTTIDIPSCTNLGGTIGNNGVFEYIVGNTISLTVPSILMISNDGNPDGDIIYLGIYNDVTINGSPYIPFTGYTGNLTLVWNDIANADLLVGDASNIADWNTFFDLPSWSTPFTGVTINVNDVILTGGENIIINDGLFNSNVNILEVTDTGCVAYLGDSCFNSCSSLTTVDLPSLTTAGPYCLSSCSSLTSINLPNLTTAGDDCFSYCSSLTTVDFSGLTAVGESCFSSCSSLTTIDLPSLTTAGPYCFYDCSSLATINFSGLTDAGESCFQDCSSLITVDLPNLTTAGDDCFNICTALTTINLPSLITAGSSCFNYNLSLITVDLPSLTTVGGDCFNTCSSLTTIDIPSCINLGPSVGDDLVFANITGNTITLTVPAALMTNNSGSPDGDIQYLQANNTVTIVEVTPTPSPTPSPTPTGSIVITPTPTPTKTSTPTPSIAPTSTPSPTFIPYTGVPVNEFYAYDIEILGNFSGGTAPSGSTAPHPIMIGNDGIPYAQMNAIQIGGFGGLNN